MWVLLLPSMEQGMLCHCQWVGDRRRLLQLENVSYGIEPLEFSATYEYTVYQIKDNKIGFSPIAENYSTMQLTEKSYKIFVKSEN
ncbi:hypothetical protein FD755_015270 [Muntiacus reevesi]|uniref:Uncharacterized protein n=1 Tax=Muntiacus reevesi TaxID=9886 RepID=A0A5N3XI05_MUNRE|nr:hypothetical protein FD755_015270 [Muntiacus reevesi]